VIVLAVLPGAQAQDLEPRAYANIPVRMNFIVTEYGYSEGGVATDQTGHLRDGALKGRTLNIQFLLFCLADTNTICPAKHA
jgi:hypothetical protein